MPLLVAGVWVFRSSLHMKRILPYKLDTVLRILVSWNIISGENYITMSILLAIRVALLVSRDTTSKAHVLPSADIRRTCS